jgi:hypothetical protein
VENIGTSITLIGGACAIALFVFRAFAWFTRKDSEAAITARDLDRKADEVRVSVLEERLERLEESVENKLTEIRNLYDDIRQMLREEHAKRSTQHEAIQQTMTQLAINTGVQQAQQVALEKRVADIQMVVERRIHAMKVEP